MFKFHIMLNVNAIVHEYHGIEIVYFTYTKVSKFAFGTTNKLKQVTCMHLQYYFKTALQ